MEATCGCRAAREPLPRSRPIPMQTHIKGSTDVKPKAAQHAIGARQSASCTAGAARALAAPTSCEAAAVAARPPPRAQSFKAAALEHAPLGGRDQRYYAPPSREQQIHSSRRDEQRGARRLREPHAGAPAPPLQAVVPPASAARSTSLPTPLLPPLTLPHQI